MPSWRCDYERISISGMTRLKFSKNIHDQGVTHAAFSGDGTLLATCGNDSRVCIWQLTNDSTHNQPELILEEDFSRFNWSRAVYVAFNKKKTSLLVLGVLKANIAGTRRGEIVILSVENEDMGTIKSRIFTRPHETGGCWFNDNYVISSEYDWLTRGISVNKLWMNKVNFTDDSCATLACMRQLYRMYNSASSSIGNIMVCNVPRQNKYTYRKYIESSETDVVLAAQIYLGENHCLHLIQVPVADNVPSLPQGTDMRTIRYIWDGYYVIDWDENPSESREIEKVCISYANEYHEDRRKDFANGVDDSNEWLWEDEFDNEGTSEEDWEYFINNDNPNHHDEEDEIILDNEIKEQILNEEDKLMLFTTGRKTYMPHQLGIKLMTRVKFKQHLDVDKSIAEFVREINVPPYHDYSQVYPMFDIVDVIFDFQGYIVGYGVSRDSRYVYVHLKPWPRGYRIPDVLDPPPAAIQPQIVVIDLAQMKVVGGSDPVQRIFTAPENIIGSSVQVTHEHVLTTAGDYGLVIDRHHGEEVCRNIIVHNINNLKFY